MKFKFKKGDAVKLKQEYTTQWPMGSRDGVVEGTYYNDTYKRIYVFTTYGTKPMERNFPFKEYELELIYVPNTQLVFKFMKE